MFVHVKLINMRILITGFEPFGGEKINPSQKILRKIGKLKFFSGFSVDSVLLPVSFKRSVEVLKNQYENNVYDFVLHLGQAGSRTCIVLEALGVNLMDSKNPDNDGYTANEEPIMPDGALAYRTKINLKKLSEYLSRNKIPNVISYHAGLYVCNTVNYYSFYCSERYSNPAVSLFVHLPFLPEQVVEKTFLPGYRTPRMSLNLQIRAVEKIIDFVSTQIISNS
ncbi:MAG TPA: peptidase C15 [Pseudothermotoga sp.]|uniref:pyroglutamyl-peptidase I n=1 Tax=Pseudothermotoga lettingae TaxID=177758 RepID=UPI0007475775|nr:pyroglutamyl-peptidase I [Pseudothermotoga lettingae]KUK20073.1 MAG: Pyroglutamyl-peptidase I [Pseudothermotoga lettingae]HBT26631.1 peptidase C15 [Pseudothermotoga sp.]